MLEGRASPEGCRDGLEQGRAAASVGPQRPLVELQLKGLEGPQVDRRGWVRQVKREQEREGGRQGG